MFEELNEQDFADVERAFGAMFLGMVFAAAQCGHTTLRGHLHYHPLHRYEENPASYMFTHWLHYMTSSSDKKEEIGEPREIIELARQRVKTLNLFSLGA